MNITKTTPEKFYGTYNHENYDNDGTKNEQWEVYARGLFNSNDGAASRADTNHNNIITETEYNAYILSTRDLSKSGAIDTWELSLADSLEDATELRDLKFIGILADNDKNGIVTQAEFNNVKSYLDFNKNGSIDTNEVEIAFFFSRMDDARGLTSTEINALMNFIRDQKIVKNTVITKDHVQEAIKASQ